MSGSQFLFFVYHYPPKEQEFFGKIDINAGKI
jgi:hypothetical protein